MNKILPKTLADLKQAEKRLQREVDAYMKLYKRLEHESFEFCRDFDPSANLHAARMQLCAAMFLIKSFFDQLPMSLIASKEEVDGQCSIPDR